MKPCTRKPLKKETAYTDSFGFEWNRFEVFRPKEDEAVFRVKTGFSPEQLRGKRVLDAGCGSGRYSAVAAKWGAQVTAMDLSQAVRKAFQIAAPLGTRCIQGDLLNPPFRAQSFDVVFSIGVLHHTPDAHKAFLEIADLVKPGGRLAVWVYRKNTWPQEFLNSLLRTFTTRLPTAWLYRFSHLGAFLGGIPLLKQILGRIVNLGSTHPDFRMRLCDAFDWYSPKYQSHHTLEEVSRWFEEAGFSDLTCLRPEKRGRFYDWFYRHNLLIGSGVNISGIKK